MPPERPAASEGPGDWARRSGRGRASLLVFALPLDFPKAEAANKTGTIVVRVRNEPRPGRYEKLPGVPVWLGGGFVGYTDANGVVQIRNKAYGTYQVRIQYQNRVRTQYVTLNSPSQAVEFVNP